MSHVKGIVIADRYELIDVIAEGGQALICSARDKKTEQLVAVKMLTSAAAQNNEFVQRLAREQEAMLALAGTSAVAVLDLCRAPGGAPCLVMELLEGMDLERCLGELEDRGERLTMDRVFEIFDAIVETLERAHAAGILHRDLKPANIFLIAPEAGGGVRLLDFGLSRIKTSSPLTQMGTILGSPSYIAPEVWGGQPDKLDQRVDVYSLSVILFRAISGHMPFSGESLHDKFVAATTAPRPSLIAIEPDLPEEIDDWVQQALAIDPNERFATVRAAWNALLSAMRYSPPRTRTRIPVKASIVSAWRAAAGAFRRVIAGGGRPEPAAPARASEPAPAKAPEPPRAKPPPPVAVRKRPRAVSAEWLLDGDVMEFEERESFDPEELLGETPAVAPVAEPTPTPAPPPAPTPSNPESAEPITRGRKRTRWRKRKSSQEVPAVASEAKQGRKKRNRGWKKKR